MSQFCHIFAHCGVFDSFIAYLTNLASLPEIPTEMNSFMLLLGEAILLFSRSSSSLVRLKMIHPHFLFAVHKLLEGLLDKQNISAEFSSSLSEIPLLEPMASSLDTSFDKDQRADSFSFLNTPQHSSRRLVLFLLKSLTNITHKNSQNKTAFEKSDLVATCIRYLSSNRFDRVEVCFFF